MVAGKEAILSETHSQQTKDQTQNSNIFKMPPS